MWVIRLFSHMPFSFSIAFFVHAIAITVVFISLSKFIDLCSLYQGKQDEGQTVQRVAGTHQENSG